MSSITSIKEDFKFIAGKEKEEIISAIRNKNLKKFKELISDLDLDKTILVDENSTILKEDEYTGKTILQQACDFRKKEIVSILLRAGATNKPYYNCSLDSNSKLLLTPFDITIIDKSFEISNLIEHYPGINVVVNTTLVPEENIEEYKKWKAQRKKSNDKKKNILLEELTKGFESLEIEKGDHPIYARAMQDNESISNKRKKNSDDNTDSDDTYETPNSSLEYERD